MHKIINRFAPSSFLEKFDQLSHSYSTCFSIANYIKPQIKLYKCTFRISIRGPAIWWNEIVRSTEKVIKPSPLVNTKMKNKFLNFENEVTFFDTFAFKNSLTDPSTDVNDAL